MSSSGLRFISALLVFMFFVLLNSVQAQGDWKAQWEKTVAAAKKEGRINIYISGYEKVVPAFQKAYPDIKVRSVTGRGSQLG